MSYVRRFFVLLLALTLMVVTSVMPVQASQASNACECSAQVKYQGENGRKVIAVEQKGQEIYVVVLETRKINDISDEAILKKQVKSKEEVVVGQRTYFRFATNFAQAREIADGMVSSKESLEPEEERSYFWNDSYIEDWWSMMNGYGYHLHLSNQDASYVFNTASTVAGYLATTIAQAHPSGKVAAAAIGAAASVAVGTIGWSIRNSDGSLDLYSPNYDRRDSECVYGNQYLGSYKVGGDWFNFTYPPSWEAYCIQ